ncbi:glycosyltransferase [Cryptosporangium sp. NPDC051539]|uniref:glycosyltransferase n=1 Tax=Cryptosporangium sp. NPDC051539 TaxID=3363962 RepID=UPI0037B76054
MRITMLAFGTRGDVQPFVTLGGRLRGRGHDVTVGTTASFRPAVEDAGLSYRPITPPPGMGEDTYRPATVEAISKSSSALRYLRTIPPPTSEQVTTLMASLERAVDGAEVMLTGTNTQMAGLLDVPARWAAYSQMPTMATREFRSAIGPQVQRGPRFNLLTHKLVGALFGSITRRTANTYLRSRGRAPVPRVNRLREYGRSVPVLYAFSEAVIPRPADWPAGCHLTGFWFDDRPVDTEDPELASFVAAGPAPVVLTLGGAWAVFDGEQTLAAAIGAARSLGRPLVVVGGPEHRGSDDVLQRTEVSFPWLFERAAAVIHAGSYGAASYCARAGVPQVTLPAAFDHPFWAARLHTLGVGTRPVPRSRLTGEALTAALGPAVTDREMRERAARLADRIRGEDGIGTACDVLERIFAPEATRSENR